MTTARDIITTSLRRINVAAIGMDPSSEDAAFALDELNLMVSAWRADGIDTGLSDLSMGDVLSTDKQYDDAIATLLADRLAASFGRPQVQRLEADRAWRILSARFKALPSATFDRALTHRGVS